MPYLQNFSTKFTELFIEKSPKFSLIILRQLQNNIFLMFKFHVKIIQEIYLFSNLIFIILLFTICLKERLPSIAIKILLNFRA